MTISTAIGRLQAIHLAEQRVGQHILHIHSTKQRLVGNRILVLFVFVIRSSLPTSLRLYGFVCINACYMH